VTRPARFGATTGGSAVVNTTIAYSYDPLYRLTAIDYSDDAGRLQSVVPPIEGGRIEVNSCQSAKFHESVVLPSLHTYNRPVTPHYQTVIPLHKTL
jgi:hypothetical protein